MKSSRSMLSRLCVSVQSSCWPSGSCRPEDPGLRSQTWGTRILAGACVLGVALAASVAVGQEIVTPYGTTGTPLGGTTSTANGVVTTTGTGTAGSRAAAPRPFRAARLTYLEGSVQVEQANATTSSAAVVNMPLVEGTVISTGGDGQAEIEFEDGSMARLTPNSGISLLNLSADPQGVFHTRMAVLGGMAYFELRAGTKYQYSVDAGGDAISPVENATVRVNFDQPPASIAVLDGSVHVVSATGSGSVEASAGQTVRSDGGSGGIYLTKAEVAPESWDRWNEDRDAAAGMEADAATDARSKFAGNQGYGWSDLDANGSWYDVPGHGEVWQPDMAANGEASANQSGDQGGDADEDQADAGQAGFDPYGYGSWVWTPAGYSWASGYGWGWLPYRCGQWSWFDGFGWGWTPSPVCGLYGFGGYGYGGYGYGVNLGAGPGGYRRPRRPLPGPGPIHPILRGPGVGPLPVSPVHRVGSERVIAGSRVQPLQPLGSGFVSEGGGVLGSALRRDYPFDSRTHTAVTGVLTTSHGTGAVVTNYRAGRQPLGTADRPSYGSVPQRPYYAPQYPAQRQEGRAPAGQYTPGQSQGGGRPAEPQRPSAPAPQRSSPPPAPASHSASAAASPKGK